MAAYRHCEELVVVVNVIMTTYFSKEVPARAKYAKEALASLLLHLNTGGSEEKLRLIIADDSDVRSVSAVDTKMELCARALVVWPDATITSSNHTGIGSSLNTAMKLVDDLFLYTTDDWVLEAPLNLEGPIKLLRAGYDLVRLGPVHPALQCVTRFDASIGWWLDLQQHYGGFCFATRPFIATKAFYDKVGPFDEHLNSYETERIYAERVAKSTAKLAYWGGINLAGPWYHVGEECVGYKEVS